MENDSDLDVDGSGLELVHVSDVFDYLGKHFYSLLKLPSPIFFYNCMPSNYMAIVGASMANSFCFGL